MLSIRGQGVILQTIIIMLSTGGEKHLVIMYWSRSTQFESLYTKPRTKSHDMLQTHTTADR